MAPDEVVNTTTTVIAGSEIEVLGRGNEVAPIEAFKSIDKMQAEDFAEFLAREGIALVEFEGSTWSMVENKDHLVGVPFVIAAVNFYEGSYGEFVAVRAYQMDGKKIVFVDGGSGIYQQMKDWTDKTGRFTAIRVNGGLRKSDYTYTDEDSGKEIPATTYYLA